jgi:leader peptidase (prepilin peptidase)/N-methyltransferase
MDMQTLPFITFLGLAGWLSYEDYNRHILPDELNYLLLWSGLLFHAFELLTGTLKSAVFGAIIGYLSLFSVAWLYQKIRRQTGLGLGDAKLFAALGAWFGWQALPSILLVASLLGITYALLTGKYKQRFAFGPCLLGAAIITSTLTKFSA